MTLLPKIAIVGRPNVGKSALFNRICKQRIAIVDEMEGVTRDRLYAKAELFGKDFEIIDTGGIDLKSNIPFNEQIKRQAEIAIEEADGIIMVVDSQVGITTVDEDVAKILHRTKKPLTLAINKVDNRSRLDYAHDFQSLGISKMVAVSAAQNFQIAELLEAAFEGVTGEGKEEEDAGIKVAILGRPNVGKSLLINTLLNEERCIVSPIAGTTRDSVDIKFKYHGKPYTLIDTAGIRRKGAEKEVVDKFAAIRTEDTIQRADICLLVVDSQEGITTQEKRIASQIEEAGKGCVILFNKWDLVKGFRMEHCLQDIEEQVSFLNHCPKLFISALTGRNLDKIFDEVDDVRKNALQRITTPELNKFIEGVLHKNHPPMISGKRLRIYYMAQVGVNPPVFVLFVNYPDRMLSSYQRFIYNQFREEYKFTGVPIQFNLRGKKGEKEEEE